VRIYLTDPAGTRAWLRAASGPEGERLLAQQERLPVDDSSLVGRAILLGEPQLGAGRASFHSAGFTTAQSELSLPMHTGEEILGALYVQAGRLGAFAPEDINLLRLLADQIGASVQNARLLDQTATSLAEIEMLNRRLTRQGWDEYLDGTRMLRHTPDPAQQWPDSLATARKQQEITADVYADDDGRSVLAVPLILRGEAIGSIGVTRPAGYHWTADEMALLEAIAARMTIIAEGIRLVDEAAMAAQREQTINEVSAHMLQRAASVDTILQRALNQLGDALGSDHVSLRIGAPPVESERQLTSVSGQGAGPHVPANGDEADAGDIGGPDELPAPPDDNGDGGMSDVA
jgi:GAF domain-containing protein